MRKSGIEFYGADRNHRQLMVRDESRLIRFADQVSRLITLPARYWQAYDTLWDAWPYANEYFSACYDWTLEQFAHGTPEFEREIREWFASAIHRGWTLYNQEERNNANDNAGAVNYSTS